MTNKEVLEMIKKNDECEEFNFTNNVKATYFVDREGNQLSFGYEKYLGRLNDHRIIFGLIEEIERNDFKKLIEETKLLVYMPESNDALWIKGVELSREQKDFIESNEVELILE